MSPNHSLTSVRREVRIRLARGGATSTALVRVVVRAVARELPPDRNFHVLSQRMRSGCMNESTDANHYPQARRGTRTYPQIRAVAGNRGTFWDHGRVKPRFLTLADVAETLNISASQTYALVRSGDLPAIKVGGRGQWRVEASVLEDYIQRMYEQTRSFIAANPTDDVTEVL